MKRTASLLAPFALLLAACGGEEPSRPSGITTGTPRPASSATAETTRTAVPTRTATPTVTFVPVTAEPTEAEMALSTLVNEDPAEIAGALVVLDQGCIEDRAALAGLTERTWRILQQRNVVLPVAALVWRVNGALPVDGREVSCEPLFGALVLELTR